MEEEQIDTENLMSYSVEKLEELFEDNKYSIQIIASLMKKYLNDKEQVKIENLFTYGNTYFILPEECWIECIDNKIGYSQSKEQYEEILKLFDKGLQDGFYFELAKKYAKFCLQLFKLGILTASQIKINFQKLIGKFNNDFNKGSKFYRKLRKFYTSQLNQSQEPKSQKEITNQIRQLFRRQLEHPLADIDITWENYQQWEDTDPNQKIEEMKKVYNQSYELVEKYLDLEEQFEVSLGGNQLGLLVEFFNGMDVVEIGFRKVQNYYERVLDEFPYEIEIWRLYIEFIKINLKIIPEQLQYYERAAKNCQQEIDFVKLFIRSMEKNHIQIERIEEQVLHFIQGMEDKQNQFILWQLLCEVHYRKVVSSVIEAQGKNKNNYFVGEISGMEKVTVIKIRDLFQRALDFFQTYNKNEQEENSIYVSNLLLYWANFETYFAKDKPAMDKTMNSYMKLNSAKCDAWIQYLNFELAFGNINSARSVIKRGVNIVKDNVQEICLEYVEFERRFGGIEEIEQAEEVMLDKISKMMNQGQQQQEQKEVMQQQQQEEIQEEVLEKKKKKGKKKEVKKTKKEEAMERENEEEEESKRIEQRRQIYYDFENTIFVKNFPKHFTEQELIEIFPNKNSINECRLVKDKETSQSRGIAYIDFVNGQQAQIACREMNNKKIEGQALQVFISKPPSHDAQLDERTLFLNDLPFSITEEILRKEFSAVGKYIEEIRIIINKATGKPKGFAYMQLSTKAAAQEALEKYSKLLINNRKIIVLLANSQKTVNNTVMLKNLAFSVNEADIIDFFREKGLEVINVLVVRTNEGKSKGTGFAEFKDYKSFMRALDFKKGELMGRTFEIIKSKSPITQKKEPEKASGLSNEQSAQFILNYGDQEQRKKERPKDNFKRKEQQRNILSINSKTREEEGSQGQDEKQIQENTLQKKVKTNDDFRSLLLGNK